MSPPGAEGSGFTFRRAVPDDVAALRRLEGRSVRSPWPDGAHARELSLPHSELWLAFEVGDVAGVRPAPIGFASFWVLGPEISLLNLATDPTFRRRGIGGQLIDLVERRGRERGGTVVFLEVRAGNEAALALYRRRGYLQVGIRKGYYADNGEDALVLSRELPAAAAEDLLATAGPAHEGGV